MNNLNKIFIALSLIGSAFFLSLPTNAQTYEVGAIGGLGLYKGDISSIPNPINIGENIQIIGRYNIDHYSTVRVNIAQSYLSGSDNNNNSNLGEVRNSDFNTSLGELSFIYEHNFFPYRKEKVRIITTPYLFIGLGAMGFNSKGGKENVTSSTINPIMPFGLGTKSTLTKHWNLILEFGSRKTFTDHLDNTHDEVNSKQNGFRNTYDWYSFLSAGLTYTIYPLKCPQ